ncbi:MAG TPA: hypothetical protein PKA27_00835 [Fimbriimonadaceae bacterium]|nr:hypothetical protein [Fimbriimonadaceae bacterium]
MSMKVLRLRHGPASILKRTDEHGLSLARDATPLPGTYYNEVCVKIVPIKVGEPGLVSV